MNNPVENEDSPKSPPVKKLQVSRLMVGFMTLGCLFSALGLLIFLPEEKLWRSGFIRIGLLMGAFWLALPTKTRSAAWAGISPQTIGTIVLAVIAFFLKVPPLLIAVVWVIWWITQFILKPLPNVTGQNKK